MSRNVAPASDDSLSVLKRSMYVATFAELRCCSLYEARGGTVVEREPGAFHGGAVTEIIYRWPTGCPSVPS